MIIKGIDEKLRKIAAINPKKAKQLWLYYLSGSGQERLEAEELIDIFLYQNIQKGYEEQIFLEPRHQQECFGAYNIGMVVYPSDKPYCPFGLREDEWIKHILITGMSGEGKTNLAFQMLKELKNHNKPFMIFDWKCNYRDLLQLQEFKDVLVYTVGNNVVHFRFNPLLPPPGTGYGQWLMKLVDVMKHAYFVGEGVESLLRQSIDSVYESCGVFDNNVKEIPTFAKLHAQLSRQQYKGRKALWHTSAMGVLDSLCFRHGLGNVVNIAESFNYQKLLNANVILELYTLSDVDKIFFTEAMILWLYEFRKHEGKREEFKHALFIEEAHHILSHIKEHLDGVESIIETSLRQIREFGEAVIAIDQEPTKLSNSIKANTYCKITFNLGNGKDMLEISTCMALTKEESEYIDLLDVGHCIVAMKGRIHQPLHLLVPKVNIKKGIIQDSDLLKPLQEDKEENQNDAWTDMNKIWGKLR